MERENWKWSFNPGTIVVVVVVVMDTHEFSYYNIFNTIQNGVSSLSSIIVKNFIYPEPINVQSTSLYDSDFYRLQQDNQLHVSLVEAEKHFEGNIVAVSLPIITMTILLFSIMIITTLLIYVCIMCSDIDDDDDYTDDDDDGDDMHQKRHKNKKKAHPVVTTVKTSFLKYFNYYWQRGTSGFVSLLLETSLTIILVIMLISVLYAAISTYLSENNFKTHITNYAGNMTRLGDVESWSNLDESNVLSDGFPFSFSMVDDVGVNNTRQLDWITPSDIPVQPLSFLKVIHVDNYTLLLVDNTTTTSVELPYQFVWHRDDNSISSFSTPHVLPIRVEFTDDPTLLNTNNDTILRVTLFPIRKVQDLCVYSGWLSAYRFRCHIIEWGTDNIRIATPSEYVVYTPTSSSNITLPVIQFDVWGIDLLIISVTRREQPASAIVASVGLWALIILLFDQILRFLLEPLRDLKRSYSSSSSSNNNKKHR